MGIVIRDTVARQPFAAWPGRPVHAPRAVVITPGNFVGPHGAGWWGQGQHCAGWWGQGQHCGWWGQGPALRGVMASTVGAGGTRSVIPAASAAHALRRRGARQRGGSAAVRACRRSGPPPWGESAGAGIRRPGGDRLDPPGRGTPCCRPSPWAPPPRPRPGGPGGRMFPATFPVPPAVNQVRRVRYAALRRPGVAAGDFRGQEAAPCHDHEAEGRGSSRDHRCSAPG
jgi:hypothetical protein